MLKTTYVIAMTAADEEIYNTLVPPDHPLRQINRIMDFSFVRPVVAEAYDPQLGRPADDPELMFRLEFLQYKYNLSDREVIQRAQTDVAFRWFLGLSLHSELPHHSLLSHFRRRLGEQRHRALFDRIVGQARQWGLVKDRLRLKDATHIIANIAVPGVLGLIRQAVAKLLAVLAEYEPVEVVRRQAAEATELERLTQMSDAEALVSRVASLRELVAWAETVRDGQRSGAAAVVQSKSFARLEQWIDYGHEILQDREPGAEDKLLSLVDPDARRGVHGGTEKKKNYFDGYVEDILEDPDSEIITAVIVGPGNADEGSQAPALVDQEEQAQGNDIAELSADRASTRGSVRRQLHERGITEHIPMIVPYQNPQYFANEAFPFDPERQCVSCPAGQTTVRQRASGDKEGVDYLFDARLCRACPLRAECTPSACQTNNIGRTVFISEYRGEYAQAREHNQTAAYSEVRKLHPRVERKHADKVRYHGARRARYRGLERVTIQCLLTNIVVNVKRIVRLVMTAVGQLTFHLGEAQAEVCPTQATG